MYRRAREPDYQMIKAQARLVEEHCSEAQAAMSEIQELS
jgi:hypothetical protein